MPAPARPPREPAVISIGSGLTRALEVTLRVLGGKHAGVPGRHVQLLSARTHDYKYQFSGTLGHPQDLVAQLYTVHWFPRGAGAFWNIQVDALAGT